MHLLEAEAKTLLREGGIPVPDFFVLQREAALPVGAKFPVMIKAQTMHGGRGKAGLVKAASDESEARHVLHDFWHKTEAKHTFQVVLVEPKLSIVREYYVSVTFDTVSRGPMLVFSKFGGMDIEVVAKRSPAGVLKLPIDAANGLVEADVRALLLKAGVKEELQAPLIALILKMYDVFVSQDAELVEINPLAEVMEDGKPTFIAADAKILLDDTALFRHDFPFPRRTGFRELTAMEKAARAIDAESHRGVAGRTLLELDGDIAFLSSGGGASITCLDALIRYGGRPANFAEYSGNPERERVAKLAKLILSKSGLRAFWLVGPTANFTDVYETLSGVMDAITELKPTFPIVIRRAGPRDAEARIMVEKIAKELGLDLTFYGEEISMTESAKILMDKLAAK